MTESLAGWLKSAEGDYQVAKRELDFDDEHAYPIVCFHAQQCIEKRLKALFFLNGRPIPKIHHLPTLVKKLPETSQYPFSEDLEALLWLTFAAGNARYPTEDATQADAQTAMRYAETLRSKLLPLIENFDSNLSG